MLTPASVQTRWVELSSSVIWMLCNDTACTAGKHPIKTLMHQKHALKTNTLHVYIVVTWCGRLLWSMSSGATIRRSGVALVSCGHSRFCSTCADTVSATGNGWPLCCAAHVLIWCCASTTDQWRNYWPRRARIPRKAGGAARGGPCAIRWFFLLTSPNAYLFPLLFTRTWIPYVVCTISSVLVLYGL